MYQIFTLVSYLQEHPVYKKEAAKFPAILDFYSMLTVSGDCGWWWAEGRQDGCRDALGQVIGHSGLKTG